MLHQGRKKEAGEAREPSSPALAAAGVVALIGVALAPLLVSIFLPGFEASGGSSPSAWYASSSMTGCWCSPRVAGLLNSHRNFFLSYVAPVLWNAAMVAALIAFGGRLSPDRLVMALAWARWPARAAFLVQVPRVLRLNREIRVRWAPRLPQVRETLRNAGPAVMGRAWCRSARTGQRAGVVLAAGAVSTLQYAQTLYILPISLFGMSVAAAELPCWRGSGPAAATCCAPRLGGAGAHRVLRGVPSFIAFALLGDVVIATLLQRGEFDRNDTLLCTSRCWLFAGAGGHHGVAAALVHLLRPARHPHAGALRHPGAWRSRSRWRWC